VLPLSPGRAERHGFEYYRRGTLSLYAALDTKTGKVMGRTAVRHTSQEFVGFLGQVVAECRPEQEIHIILDNLSAHKTQAVREFLAHHPHVQLRFRTHNTDVNDVPRPCGGSQVGSPAAGRKARPDYPITWRM
jgi:hypothetical protein